MSELRRVIIEKFPRARHELEIYEKLLRRYAVWVPLGNQTIVVSRDPDDDKFIETALAGGCRYIFSGDKDLLDLVSYQDIRVIKATEFLQLLNL